MTDWNCTFAKYASEEHAAWALSVIKRRGRGGGKLRAYLCPDCGSWHVGSRPA